MTFIDRIRSTIDNLFVPRDGLYDQAREIMQQTGADRDGRISLQRYADGSTQPLPGLLGVYDRGFITADRQYGNGDGYASTKEVRKLLQAYDVGDPLQQAGADDKRVDGVEMLKLVRDMLDPATAAPKLTAADDEAARGAAMLTNATVSQQDLPEAA